MHHWTAQDTHRLEPAHAYTLWTLHTAQHTRGFDSSLAIMQTLKEVSRVPNLVKSLTRLTPALGPRRNQLKS